jgi:putative membrane protein
MRALTWLIRIAVFLALFGLALNNRQDAVMHGFFGGQWQAPLILMCLIFFAAGCALGALAVLWHQWRKRPQSSVGHDPAVAANKPVSAPPAAPRYARATTVPSQFGAEASAGTHTVHSPSQRND